jgi:hypothetical protein
MNDDQFGDPISGEWPMPHIHEYVLAADLVERIHYEQCQLCGVTRGRESAIAARDLHDAHLRYRAEMNARRVPTWWERFKEWAVGWNTDEA